MADPLAPKPASRKPVVERWLEEILFRSRWLMAPMYLGLVGALGVVVWIFFVEFVHEIAHISTMSPEDVILMVLALIDLSLAGNLLLIVIFSGYENFVSKIDTAEHEDRPGWMGTVDFSGLKMKLIASIVAISAIALLRGFMQMSEGSAEAPTTTTLMWMLIVHVTFVVSGVLLALMDWLAAQTDKH